ncbi:hypothetical protein EDD27_3609 [Nonomuraea polychroma]|uniref:Uncharacterized protein n=1 Tax=Nonomuraea polychroma TaxID=46176 RepID=A0A438M5J9_9ACTN|nr:hypothetical protein [Nonomuraea polychroma]RVX41140.1 hypothetical protein EDD27_3609 [Nonomuraea polychroma]
MSEDQKVRIVWVPQVRDPEAPTADELAAGVPLGEADPAVIDDGLQFTKADGPPTPFLPRTDRYKVIRYPGGMDVIREDLCSLSEPDWIVLRPAEGVPPDALPPGIDGWWLDRYGWSAEGTMLHSSGTVLRFAPAGRFEAREDGAVAEVFEVWPGVTSSRRRSGPAAACTTFSEDVTADRPRRYGHVC